MNSQLYEIGQNSIRSSFFAYEKGLYSTQYRFSSLKLID